MSGLLVVGIIAANLGSAPPAKFDCNAANLRICGSLRAETSETFFDPALSNQRVLAAIYGGDSRLMLDFAGFVEHHNTEIVISDICASSCVEVLLPALGRIEVEGSPLIAVHGSVHMILHLLESKGVETPECYRRFVTVFDEVVERRVHPELGREQAERLGVHNVEIDFDRPECPHVSYDTEVDYWVPSQGELIVWYGVELIQVGSSNTADDIQAAIDLHFTSGQRVRAGSQTFVSK